jgi:hypothetical protein
MEKHILIIFFIFPKFSHSIILNMNIKLSATHLYPHLNNSNKIFIHLFLILSNFNPL